MFDFLRSLLKEAFPIVAMPQPIATRDITPVTAEDMRDTLSKRNDEIAELYELQAQYGDIPLKTITGLTHLLVREYFAPIERMTRKKWQTDDNAQSRATRIQVKYFGAKTNFFEGLEETLSPETLKTFEKCVHAITDIQTREANEIPASAILHTKMEPSIANVITALQDVSKTISTLATDHTDHKLALYAQHLSEVTKYYTSLSNAWATDYGLPHVQIDTKPKASLPDSHSGGGPRQPVVA